MGNDLKADFSMGTFLYKDELNYYVPMYPNVDFYGVNNNIY
jgi:hypothetical protein